ncbi:MAG: FGGY family carbohydrate kinase [Spirochaetota bacterium]
MILAIDIGTTSAKAAVFAADGSLAGLSRLELPAPAGRNALEQEVAPRTWTQAAKKLLQALSKEEGVDLGRLRCVAVSGQGPTILAVDDRGEVLQDAMTWLDRRAQVQSERIGRLLGYSLDPAFNLPKVLWIKENRPDIYEKTRWFVSCPEYLVAQLSGSYVSFLPAQGYTRIIWDDQALERLDLDKTKFPPFAGLGEVVGRVDSRGAKLFGLPQGIPVVSGGPDFIASLIGTATTKEGRACDRSGTSEGINLCWGAQADRDPRLLYMPHVVPPYQNISGVISTTGRAVSWFIDSFGGELGSHEDFFKLSSWSKPGAGSLLFLPYLSGERAPLWDPKARGAFIGLTLGHGKKEMARAVAESAAFAMRDVIEVMEGTGAMVGELRVTGKPAANAVLNQIKANITGKPIFAPQFLEAELSGDLCLAMVALKESSSIAEAAEAMVSLGRLYEPEAGTKALYDDLFGLYRRSYAALKDIFGDLSASGEA